MTQRTLEQIKKEHLELEARKKRHYEKSKSAVKRAKRYERYKREFSINAEKYFQLRELAAVERSYGEDVSHQIVKLADEYQKVSDDTDMAMR